MGYTLYYSLISMVIGPIIIAVIVSYKRRFKKIRSAKAIKVTNPLVLNLAIGKYDLPQNEEDNELPGKARMNDLDGIEHDVRNMHMLFGDRLNYDVWPKMMDGDIPIVRWTEETLKQFFEKAARYLSINIGRGKCFDGLICIISCHGIPRFICTSDYKLYSKVAIHRTLSQYVNLRGIPRLFLFDCCQGANSIQEANDPAVELQKSASIKSATSTESEKKVEDED